MDTGISDLPQDMNTGINDLPSNVIEDILMNLPLKEAARTSVLSSRWRYLWTRLSKIKFDIPFCQSPDGLDSEGSDYLAWKYKLLSTIYQILLHHQAPIVKFELSLSEEISFPEIDTIIKYLPQTVVQDLTIDFPLYHELPSYIFSCRHLKHLALSSCVINPPPLSGELSELVSLDVFDVTFVGAAAQRFFKCFPQLEVLCIICSHSDLEIDSPHLLYVDLKGDFSVSFKHIPKLVSAQISAVTWIDSFNEFILLLRTVQNLEVFLPYQLGGNINVLQSRPIRLANLKNLSFTNLNLGTQDHMAAALWLIRSSPNVESVVIQLGLMRLVDEKTIYNVELVIELLRHVHELRLEYEQLHERQLEVIKFILAKSPKLKNFIMWSCSHEDNSSTRTKVEPETMKYIHELPCASAMAKVRFVDRCKDSVVIAHYRECLPACRDI